MHTIPQTIYAQVSTKSAALRGEPNMPIDLQESSDLIPNFPWVSDGECAWKKRGVRQNDPKHERLDGRIMI